jgi:hypothetical protein
MSDPLEPLKNELGKIAGQSAERQDKLFNRLQEMLEKYPERGPEYIETLIKNTRSEQRLCSAAIILILAIIAAAATAFLKPQLLGSASADDAVQTLAAESEPVTFYLDSGMTIRKDMDSAPITVGRLYPGPQLRLRTLPPPADASTGAIRSSLMADLFSVGGVSPAVSFPLIADAKVYKLAKENAPFPFRQRYEFKNLPQMFLVIDSLDVSDTARARYSVSFIYEQGGAEVRFGPYFVERSTSVNFEDEDIADPEILQVSPLSRRFMAILNIGNLGRDSATHVYQAWRLKAFLIGFEVKHDP